MTKQPRSRPWTDRGQSTIKRGRTAKGANTARVVKHGRSHVVGSFRPIEEPPAIDDLRRADRAAALFASHAHVVHDRDARTVAWDGRTVEAVTEHLYGHLLPAAIGTEVRAWSEVLPQSVSDELGAGHARHRDLTLSRGLAADGLKHAAPRMAWPDREQPSLQSRRGETVRVDYHDGQSVTTLPADAMRDDRVYYGHGPAVTRIPTVRERERAAAAATREAIDETLPADVPLHAAIEAIAARLPAGSSVRWAHGDTRGTLSRSPSDRYSASIRGTESDGLRGHRTVYGLRRAVKRATI